MNDDRREACTTNAAGSIVSGSKVAHEGEIYIVGQVKGNDIELLKGSFSAGFIDMEDVEAL